jgi:hypothetical protein
LVGDDDELESGIRKPLESSERSGREHDLLYAVEVFPFLNQHPVAIQKNSAAHFARRIVRRQRV